MHHRKTYRYINFQQNRVGRSIKTMYTNVLAKPSKLHKFATCCSNFNKSRLLDMHYPITGILVNFGIHRLIRYQINVKINYLHRRQMDRQTNRQTDGQTSRTTINRYFFSKKDIVNSV